MVKEIYGKKIGMTQIFSEDGLAIPVTAVEAKPLVVVAKTTISLSNKYLIITLATPVWWLLAILTNVGLENILFRPSANGPHASVTTLYFLFHSLQ